MCEEVTKTEKKNIEELFCDYLERWPKIHALYVKWEEILVYLVVGVLTTIVSWAAKFLFNAIFFGNTMNPDNFQNFILSTVNWTAGVIYAYFTNRKYVFKSHAPMLQEAPKFVLSRVSTYILDIVVMQLLCNVMGLDLIVGTLISAVLVTVTNYIFSKLLVFKKGKNEDEQ